MPWWSPGYWGILLGLAAYAVGIAALVSGALLSGRLGARWMGRRWLFDSHQWLSWGVLALGVVHALLLWPRRAGAAGFLAWWWPIDVPTIPFAIALGPFVVYALGVVAASYYGRRRLGYPLWRWLHALAYPALVVALWHGVESGPDSWHPVLRAGYVVTVALVAAVVVVRLGGPWLRAVRRAPRA